MAVRRALCIPAARGITLFDGAADLCATTRALGLTTVVVSNAVMIGDSEAKDIEAARALGMRTIRVAIETPVPETSAADAVASSLLQVAEIFSQWATAAPAPVESLIT